MRAMIVKQTIKRNGEFTRRMSYVVGGERTKCGGGVDPRWQQCGYSVRESR